MLQHVDFLNILQAYCLSVGSGGLGKKSIQVQNYPKIALYLN